MAIQRRPTGKTTGKAAVPPRGGTTSKQRKAPPGAPKANPMGLYIGGGVGAVVLILIVAVMMKGGDEEKKPKPKVDTSAETDPTKPDYARQEAVGRRKVDSAISGIREKSGEIGAKFAKATQEQREAMLSGLQGIIDDKDKGFEALEEANRMIDDFVKRGGKGATKINVAGLRKDWDLASNKLVKDLEREGHASAEKGYNMLMASQPKWEAAPPDLKATLREGLDLMKAGMICCDYMNQLSGQAFDTKKYIELRRLAGDTYKKMQ